MQMMQRVKLKALQIWLQRQNLVYKLIASSITSHDNISQMVVLGSHGDNLLSELYFSRPKNILYFHNKRLF